MALSFSLHMLIMQIRSFVCRRYMNFILPQCVLVGQWPERPSSTIVLVAASARTMGVPDISSPVKKLN